MRLLIAEQPDNAFYQAAFLLLEASQRHILRYSALAQEMALACPDERRRQELVTIAEVSGIIPLSLRRISIRPVSCFGI